MPKVCGVDYIAPLLANFILNANSLRFARAMCGFFAGLYICDTARVQIAL